jgi:hypothetical protein
MTTLSIMLYLAGVFGGLTVLGICLIILSFVTGFIMPPKDVEMFSEDHHSPCMGFLRKTTILLFSIGIFLTIFIPSKETTYMIIATEMTNRAIQTEEAKIILDKVNQYFDLKLEGMKK